MRVGLLWWDFCPYKKKGRQENSLSPPLPSLPLSPHIKKGLREDIIRKRILTKNLTMVAP